MRGEAHLICMRLQDMMRQHPGQDNSKTCSLCGARVGIYPTGQAQLRKFRDVKIVCHVCALNEEQPYVVSTAGTAAEHAREMMESIQVKGED
jgi:hypothetical protein